MYFMQMNIFCKDHTPSAFVHSVYFPEMNLHRSYI